MSRKPYLLLLFWKKFSKNLLIGLSLFMLLIGILAAKGDVLQRGADSANAQTSEEYPESVDPYDPYTFSAYNLSTTAGESEEYPVLTNGTETQEYPVLSTGTETQEYPVLANGYESQEYAVQQPVYSQPTPSYYEGPGCNGTHAVWGKWDGNNLVSVIQDNGNSSECGYSAPSNNTTSYSPTTGYNPYPSYTTPSTSYSSSGYEGPGCDGSHSVWAVWRSDGSIERIEADYGAQAGECNNPGLNAAGQTSPRSDTGYNPYPSSSGTWEFKYPQCRGNQVVDVYQNTATGAYEERNPHYQEDACGNNQQWEGPGCNGNHSVWGIFSADGSRLISVEKDYGVKAGECNNPYPNTTTITNTSAPVYSQTLSYQDQMGCDGKVSVTRRIYTNGQTSIIARNGQIPGYCGVGYGVQQIQTTNVYTGYQGTGAYYAPYPNTAYNPYSYTTTSSQGTGGYYAPYVNTAYNPYAYTTYPYQGTGGYYAPYVTPAYNPYTTTPPPFQGVGGYYAPYSNVTPPPFQGVGGYYAPYSAQTPPPFQGTGGYYAPYPNAAPPPFQGVGGYYAPYPTVNAAYDPYAYQYSQGTTPPPYQGTGAYYAPYPTYTPSYQGTNGYGSTQPTASNKTIIIRSMSYQPANITINAGDSITWSNLDSTPHTATADDNSWATQTIQNGQSAAITFTNPGTYNYHCAIHPNMKGTITVIAPNSNYAASTSTSSSSSNGTMAYSSSGATTGTQDPKVIAQNPETSITELPKTGVPIFAWAVSGLLPLGMKLRKSKSSEGEENNDQSQPNALSANTLWIERELNKKG